MRIHDKAEIKTRRKSKNGFMLGDALVARTGTQSYSPTELTRAGVDVPDHLVGRKEIIINRPEAEVFKDSTLVGMEHLPLTIDHPEEDVRADNVAQLQVGFTRTPAIRDGDFVRVPVMFQDKKAVKLIEDGIDQLSVGYDADIVFFTSKDAKIKGYDGNMINIAPNHIALVDKARGGSNVRILDKGEENMAKIAKIVDGISYEFDAQNAQVVDGLQAKADALTSEMTKLKDSISELQGKLDATQKELEKEKSARLSDADIAKLVAEKGQLIEKAKAFLGDSDLSAKSDIEIKKDVILSVHDSVDFEGKDDTYINAMFDTVMLAGAPKKDNSAQKLGDSIVADTKKELSPRDAMIARRNKRS